VWQAAVEELGPRGFVAITVAVDRGPDDARPWIEAARPSHPSLIDPRHVVADLYNVVNVPTAMWIDERGRIVRPNDVVFGTDTFRQLTGIDSATHLAALRAWVGGGATLPEDRVRALTRLPTADDQQARAEFALGQWLTERRRHEAAAAHFVRAGELAPHDWTIRRGSMPIRGLDPMGEALMPLWNEWVAAGLPYYPPMKPVG